MQKSYSHLINLINKIIMINPPASYPEYTRRSGDVTVVGMRSILVATFFFLTFERNHLERPATSLIKAWDYQGCWLKFAGFTHRCR